MLIPLEAAAADQCGPKAAALATLIRAGLPIPPGVVIPFDALTPRHVRRVVDSGADPSEFQTQIHDSPNRPRTNPHDSTTPHGTTAYSGESTAPDADHSERALPVPREGTGIGQVGQSEGPDAGDIGRRDGEVGFGVGVEVGRWLAGLGDGAVVVRSSAADGDGALGSAAGQYDSFLGVRGIDAVMDAVRACHASLWSARATAYRKNAPAPAMAVIIQRHLDADVSGVMFTSNDGPTLIEASWGLGPSVVEGRVTPDRYEVTAGTVTRTIADKPTSLERSGPNLVVRSVPSGQRRTPTLTDATAVRLAALGHRAATNFGSPQDLEWAITGETLWLLQSRPITAHPPTATEPPEGTFSGIPASQGIATGPARIVRGPSDFAHVRAGDILVCPHTDPSWTPLLSIAAGIITETGGILSHAAIVAREHGIPAVLAVPDATTRIPADKPVTINGSTGAVRSL